MDEKKKQEIDFSNTHQKIIPVEIGNEMQKSFLDYAMSVIVARALPGRLEAGTPPDFIYHV